MDVQAIAEPRVQAAAADEKKSDRPSAKPPHTPPTVDGLPLKRPTLILYGGAPQEDAERASSAPPIVATRRSSLVGLSPVSVARPFLFVVAREGKFWLSVAKELRTLTFLTG